MNGEILRCEGKLRGGMVCDLTEMFEIGREASPKFGVNNYEKDVLNADIGRVVKIDEEEGLVYID